MASPVLIIGKDHLIKTKLTDYAKEAGEVVVTMGHEASHSPHHIFWNRKSFISTKTATRELIRTQGMPHTVYLLFGEKYDENFPSTNTSIFDEIIDVQIKGAISLTQELYKKAIELACPTRFYFIGYQLNDKKKPISYMSNQAIKQFALALMDNNPSLYLSGFELENSDTEGFFDYIIKHTYNYVSDKHRNHWNIYPKPRFFSNKHS
jgi:hypothetical protein